MHSHFFSPDEAILPIIRLLGLSSVCYGREEWRSVAEVTGRGEEKLGENSDEKNERLGNEIFVDPTVVEDILRMIGKNSK